MVFIVKLFYFNLQSMFCDLQVFFYDLLLCFVIRCDLYFKASILLE